MEADDLEWERCIEVSRLERCILEVVSGRAEGLPITGPARKALTEQLALAPS